MHSNPNGSLSIAGVGKGNIIGVPAGLRDMDTLLKLLKQRFDIVIPRGNQTSQLLLRLVPFAALGLMFTVYVAQNKLLVGLSGTTLLAIIGWSIYETWRSKNIDTRTKRSSLAIVIVIGSRLAWRIR